MKKEKTIKTYQRRIKSGKMVTVKQHTAKYDAADKAKEMATKDGAGGEFTAKKEKMWQLPMSDFLKKMKEKDMPEKEETPDTPKNEATPKKTPKSTKSPRATKTTAKTQANGVSASDFKSWYHFNDWDKPKKSWPAEVRAADAAIRKQLGSKKAYDDYCSQIDGSYSKSGHNKAFKSFGGGAATSTGATKSKSKPISDNTNVKALNKELAELIAKNGGTINRGNKESKRIKEIFKQLDDIKASKKREKTSTAGSAAKTPKTSTTGNDYSKITNKSLQRKITKYAQEATNWMHSKDGRDYTWKDTLRALSDPGEKTLRRRVDMIISGGK